MSGPRKQITVIRSWVSGWMIVQAINCKPIYQGRRRGRALRVASHIPKEQGVGPRARRRNRRGPSQREQTQRAGELEAPWDGSLMLRAWANITVLSRRLTSRHVETEQLYQEERRRRQWPVGRFRVYLETSNNRVIGGSDVGYKRKLEGESRALGFGGFLHKGRKSQKRNFGGT